MTPRPSCIKCYAGSDDTELYRGSDGHFRKVCHRCKHVGGPFVSQQEPDERQTGLEAFA